MKVDFKVEIFKNRLENWLNSLIKYKSEVFKWKRK